MNFKENVPERWVAKYDRTSDRWLILDTWHEQIQNISDYTHDVPDTHPAVKIISGGELNAVLGELKGMSTFKTNIIKAPDTDNIINKAHMSNVEIASILERIATDLKERKIKKNR